MKIDKRHRYGILLDTETANTIMEEDGKLCTLYSLPYDLGFKVIDTKGRQYENHSYVNADIFYGERELMQSAYYSKKIPQYIEDIKSGKRIVKNTYQLRKIIFDLIKKYDIKFVVAHNCRFDLTALNNIQRWTTKSKYRYFFPKGIEFWDTLKMARDVIGKKETYRQFCEENGFMTKHSKPQPQFTAEVLYRFITQDTEFVESHTGFEDVEIELEIFKYCVRQKKKMRKKLFEKFQKNP